VDYLNSKPNAGNGIIAKTFKLGNTKDKNGKVHPATEVVSQARERLGWEYELTDFDVA